jgi:serine O-acetyltransferase
MLNALRMLGEDLREKARYCYKSDDARAVLKVMANDGTPAMVLYRLMQGSRESHLAPLEMVFNKLNSVLSNCVIGRGAEFGPGFVIFHSSGVLIHGKVRGGSHVHLAHEVTIDDNEAGDCPVLGSNIKIGAGAKLIGGVKVGDGARIGANAVVLRDVAPDTTFTGAPTKPTPHLARGRAARRWQQRVALVQLAEARARKRG